jgi:hypothetical protein
VDQSFLADAAPQVKEVAFEVTAAGTMHAVVYWFECRVGDGCVSLGVGVCLSVGGGVDVSLLLHVCLCRVSGSSAVWGGTGA